MKRVRLVAAFLLCAACTTTTTWTFQRIEGEVPSIRPELWSEVRCAGLEARGGDGGCAASFAPVVACEKTPSLCQHSLTDAVPVACDQLEPMLSFVHLSDVRLREHAVLVSDEGTTALPAARDQLYRHDDAVLLATVLGINQLGLGGTPLGSCPAVGAPRFVIHTGNAVEIGLFSELTQFISAMNELAVPWLNVVGPNDVGFLGSRPNERVAGVNAIVPYVPIGNVDRFMNFHAMRGVKTDVTLPNPSQRQRDEGPSMNGCRREPNGRCDPDPRYPRSLFHGFDANCPKTPDAGLTQLEQKRDGLCSAARGTYTLTVPANQPGTAFKLIVLNTAENVIDDGATPSAGGTMLDEQVRWLRRELDALGPTDFALVFGHEPLSAFEPPLRAKLVDALASHPRVLGYFHGGDGDTLRLQRPEQGGRGFYEVGAASLLEAPQRGRAIDVLRAPDGSLSLRLAAFSQPQTGGAPADPTPTITSGECAELAQGTSFCHRLGVRAARGVEAARQLALDAGARPPALQGFVRVFNPDGGTP